MRFFQLVPDSDPIARSLPPHGGTFIVASIPTQLDSKQLYAYILIWSTEIQQVLHQVYVNHPPPMAEISTFGYLSDGEAKFLYFSMLLGSCLTSNYFLFLDAFSILCP